MFLGVIWPTSGSLNIVEWSGGHPFNPFSILGMCLVGIIGVNSGQEAFLGLILLVSEAPESQLKVFFGLIWPSPDSIKKVGWPGGHLNPCSTLGM